LETIGAELSELRVHLHTDVSIFIYIEDNKQHFTADITCTMNYISTQANKVITYLPSTSYNNTHFTGVP
jgi:hypothetical protein